VTSLPQASSCGLRVDGLRRGRGEALAIIAGREAVPPLMLGTEANPGSLPIDLFDGIRKDMFDNRSQFFKDLHHPPLRL